jgi:hypothetical protein
MSAANKEKWEKYVGESVIKDFNDDDANDEGDSQTFKGSVVSFSIWGNDEDGIGGYPLFRIVYSDGDEEDIAMSELKSKCHLFDNFSR